MTIEKLIEDTFTEHEHLSPDEHAVFAAVRREIDAGDARRRRPSGRSLAVAASVVAVVTAAVAVATVSQAPSRPSPHSPRSVAIRPASSSAPHTGTTIAAQTMPFDLGWLPTGDVHYDARRINIGSLTESGPPVFDGEYLLTVATSTGVLFVDVSQMPGTLDGQQFKSGAGRSVSIAGRPGVESADAGGAGGYELYFEDSAGGLAYVNVTGGGKSTTPHDLTRIGRRVAAHMHLPGTATVQPRFGIGYVPSGMHVRAFDVEDGNGLPTTPGVPSASADGIVETSYDLGSSTSQEPSVQVSTAKKGAAPSGRAGQVVQGHPTRYRIDGGFSQLEVLDAVDGYAVTIESTLPLSELYQIADGLVLPG